MKVAVVCRSTAKTTILRLIVENWSDHRWVSEKGTLMPVALRIWESAFYIACQWCTARELRSSANTGLSCLSYSLLFRTKFETIVRDVHMVRRTMDLRVCVLDKCHVYGEHRDKRATWNIWRDVKKPSVLRGNLWDMSRKARLWTQLANFWGAISSEEIL